MTHSRLPKNVPATGSSLKGFFEFIEERHAIYYRRYVYKDPWPWTSDPILKAYKFTNIFRELDTGTIHCRKCIREPYADHPELFFNVATYRLYNLIGTQKAIGFIKNYAKQLHDILDILYTRQLLGHPIFTGAHMITGTLGGDKIHQVFETCFLPLWERRKELEPQPGDTLEKAFKRLCGKVPGYGPFISYEVISDLRWTRYLKNASDINTWANPGPGCMRGINRIIGLPLNPKKQMSEKDYIQTMQDIRNKSWNALPEWVGVLEMRDVEHSLCEFDKYERARLGQGRPRNTFIPPHLRK